VRFAFETKPRYKYANMNLVRSPRWRRWVVFLGLWAVTWAASARAATDKREIEARADFAAGRYQQAIDLFAQLYGETLNPIYLRNIGRCQQGLNQSEAAIKSFREYLKKAKGLKADERLEIEGYIKEMGAMSAAQQPATSPPAAPAASPAAPQPSPASAAAAPPAPSTAAAASPAPAPAAAALPPVVTPTPVAVPPAQVPSGPASPEPGAISVLSTSPPPSRLVHPWRVPGIAVTAVGAVLIGTGVAFGLSARNDASAVSATYDPSQADAGKRNAKIGAAADIVGAAAVVTGIVLITHAVNAPSPSASGLRAGALADSRSGLLLLEGTF
jgi:hypothetical protein